MRAYFIAATAVLLSVQAVNAETASAQGPQQTTATYEDWTVRCVTLKGIKSCEMAQTMQIKGQTRPITQIAIGRQPKNGSLKIVFEMPVNVSLPDGVHLVTDDKKFDMTASFSRCVPVGCFAETNISEAQIKTLRSLKKTGKLAFKNAAKQQIAIPVSFKGFGSAYDALPKP
ncbi:MAG: invasion associated locus B family protein [Pseudolabrys sp.]